MSESSPFVTRPVAGHNVHFERSGFTLADTVTPVCSCGWRGRPESESNDWMWTNLHAQESHHKNESLRGERSIEREQHA